MRYYSFDLFDTCFVRACGDPKNIFDLLAYRILGDDSSDSVRYDFSQIRIEGEKKARKLSNKKEISLDDIYMNCDFSGLTSLSNKKILMAEMEIEKEQLVPVYSIWKKIRELHQEGHGIYYISDMYLPYEFLLNLLKEYDFWKDKDSLYVSSACYLTKFAGTLYEKVASENNLSYQKWIHWGDNKYSDYFIPKKKGIHASLVQHKYSFYEHYLLKQDYFFGFFVNQHPAGISKAVRLSFPNTPQYAFAADLIAPLYVPFVYKVLLDATLSGIKKIFFLARDGYILYQIAQSLQSEFPNIELRYLYVSRSSLYLPGLQEINSNSLQSLTKTEFGFTNENKLEILANFIVPEVLEQIKKVTFENLNEDIFSNNSVLSILSQYNKKQQDLIYEYFIQEGLADMSLKVAVVDVRGTRSCLQAINTILSNKGYTPVKGYYLEVFKNRKTIKETGDYSSIYYHERFRNNSLIYIYELGNIFEQYFSLSPHLRTIAYKKNRDLIQPVFEESEIDNVVVNTVKCHEDVMALFSKLFISNKLHLHVNSTLFLTTKVLIYFSQKPIYRYLSALNPVRINNKKGKYIYIVKRISLNSIRKHNISWWRGSVYFLLRTVAFSKVINPISFCLKKIYHRTTN